LIVFASLLHFTPSFSNLTDNQIKGERIHLRRMKVWAVESVVPIGDGIKQERKAQEFEASVEGTICFARARDLVRDLVMLMSESQPRSKAKFKLARNQLVYTKLHLNLSLHTTFLLLSC